MKIHRTPMTVLPGLTASPNYATGDSLGTNLTVSGLPEHGIIRGVTVVDRADQDVNIDFVFSQSSLTVTDTAAFDPTDAELENVVGVIQVNSWFSFNDNSVGCEANTELPYQTNDGSLIVQGVTRGAHNLAATTDIRISLLIEYA